MQSKRGWGVRDSLRGLQQQFVHFENYCCANFSSKQNHKPTNWFSDIAADFICKFPFAKFSLRRLLENEIFPKTFAPK